MTMLAPGASAGGMLPSRRETARPGSLAWFARHELRLAWRDTVAMLSAGKSVRPMRLALFLALFTLGLHGLAALVLVPGGDGDTLGRHLVVTALLVPPFALMLSQALESVTRVFFSRADLDLILASPADPRRLFAVRVTAVAAGVSLMATLLFAPAVNVMAWREGAHWLAAYGVAPLLGLAATTIAVLATAVLFAVAGARRTRLLAQVIAALVGAGFVIAVQLAAIASSQTLSRLELVRSPAVRALAPEADSPLWWPARAVQGDPMALAGLAVATLVLFALSLALLAPGFAARASEAAGLGGARGAAGRIRPLTVRSPAASLRAKEWRLLKRDPWLVSQSLMQLLYLVPPAAMLWKGFGGEGMAGVIAAPVLVMATGQLAGGLAWLALSGEDAPQLVATAPVPQRLVIRAKVEAVLAVVGALALPFLVAMAFLAPALALVTAAGVLLASGSAVLIQFWFRSHARRSSFRRRQTASRVATFAEAFASILWAGATGLAVHGSPFALAVAGLALAVLAIAYRLRAPLHDGV